VNLQVNLRKILGLPERVSPLAKAFKQFEDDLVKRALEGSNNNETEARGMARFDMVHMSPVRLIEELIRRGA
jgi:hypothetical protein